MRHSIMRARMIPAGTDDGLVAARPRVPLRPAIIFDCDGVLNEEPGGDGVLHPEDVRLLPGAGEAVKAARDAGCLTVMITNRAQVAKGVVSLPELERIFARIETLIGERGGTFEQIYFCPHHPDPGTPGAVPEFSIRCQCRKPGALLLRRAFAELPIDVARTALIGDSLRDIGAGRAAGIASYGVMTGYRCRDVERYAAGSAPAPDLLFANVSEAVAFCTSFRRIAAPVLAALPARRPPTPTIVAVAGRASAGKSAVAHAVARTLAETGERVLHVRLPPEPDNLMPIVTGLRQARPVAVPHVEPALGHLGTSTVHDPEKCAVVILDGNFAAHPSVRPLVDLAVFVTAPEAVRHARFAALHRWNGLAEADIDALWAKPGADPPPDAQRQTADLVIASPPGAE